MWAKFLSLSNTFHEGREGRSDRRYLLIRIHVIQIWTKQDSEKTKDKSKHPPPRPPNPSATFRLFFSEQNKEKIDFLWLTFPGRKCPVSVPMYPVQKLSGMQLISLRKGFQSKYFMS